MVDNDEGGGSALVPVASTGPTLPAAREQDLVPTFVSDIASAKQRLVQLQEFVRDLMVEGEDYGTIPGTSGGFGDAERKKPRQVLLKPGAEKLCEIYGLAQVPVITTRVEDFDRGFFHYECRIDLVSKRSGTIVGSGVGSCNSHESRYRYRNASRKCPSCGQAAIIKGKAEFGGGWVCFKKKGGCGSKFGDNDQSIAGQAVGKVENPDVADLVNTILKMAKKRALIDATLSVTRCSGLFTQDEEVQGYDPEGAPGPAGDGPPPVPPAGAAGDQAAFTRAANAGRQAPPPAASAPAPTPAPAPAPPAAAATGSTCGCPCGCGAAISEALAAFSMNNVGAHRCRACYPHREFDFARHENLPDLQLPKRPGLTPAMARAAAQGGAS